MLKFKVAYFSLLVVLFLAACGGGQEPASATPEVVVVPVTVEVTRLVEVEKEVTVEVPVEVEVTRLVTTTVVQVKEMPIEVTRLVTVEVTAVPEPTATPAPTTAAVATTRPTGFSDAQLLSSMNTLRQKLQEMGGMLDSGILYCDDWLVKHDQVANMPTYNTAYANNTSKWAYEQYRAAINIFISSSKDMTENARLSCVPGSTIPFQQWGLARQGINQALDTVHPAIKALGGE